MQQLKQFLSTLATGNLLVAGAIGLVGGVISGLFGVGGGIVLVPAMMFFLGMGIKAAVGTSLVVIIPTAITGALKHHQLGNIDWKIVLALIPTATLGGYLGAWLTEQISAGSLKRAFGGFLILVGCKLLLFK